MDTKQDNKALNFQINAFSKGMNSDASLDMVSNEQYLFGQNVRITNNSLILGDINPNSKEGIVTPVSSGTEILITGFPTNVKEILAVQSIEDVGVVIVKTVDDKWSVYRVEKSGDSLSAANIFNSTDTTDKHRFSIVLNKELNDVLNLYIADGKHNVMLMNVLENNTSKKEIDLMSNHIFPQHKVTIVDTISGNLKTSLVQYTYRLYKKYGVCSKLAPLTNKILIIDNNRNKEIGNAEDTVTSVGLKLKITIDHDLANNFDHIQLFRLSYIKPGLNAEIDLISDLQYTAASSGLTTIEMNDEGIKSLQGLSMDEFAAMYGLNVVPQIIESNQGYLFGANIEDKTASTQFDLNAADFVARSYKTNGNDTYDGHINESADINSNFNQTDGYHYYKENGVTYVGGKGEYVKYRLVTLAVPIHDKKDDGYSSSIPTTIGCSLNTTKFKYLIYNNDLSIGGDASTAESYITNQEIESSFKISYDNTFTSSLFRSLRRNETYRYGIVFYNKFGDRTDVFWIADIKTPAVKDLELTSEITYDGKTSMAANILGIEFTVANPKPNDIIGYEIVRCLKTDAYSNTLLQCALSRPLRQGKYDNDEYRTPWYPNFLISTDFAVVSHNRYKYDGLIDLGNGHTVSSYYYYLWQTEPQYNSNIEYRGYFDKNATNYENDNVFQIFSSEILTSRTDALNKLSHSQLQLSLIDYINSLTTGLFGMSKDEPYMQYDSGDSSGPNTNNRPKALFEYAWQHDPETDYLIRGNSNNDKKVYYPEFGILSISPLWLKFNKSSKPDQSYLVNLYNTKDYITSQSVGNVVDILNIADVKNPTWEQGFTSIDNGGDNSEIINGVKSYKGYSTSVGGENYVNWICNGMYDLAIYKAEAQAQLGNEDEYTTVYTDTHYKRSGYNPSDLFRNRDERSIGWIGPGPVCMLIKTDRSVDNDVLRKQYTAHYDDKPVHKWTRTGESHLSYPTDVYTHEEFPQEGGLVYGPSGYAYLLYLILTLHIPDPSDTRLWITIVNTSTGEVVYYFYDKYRILRHIANPGTLRANITHNATQFSGTTLELMQYDTYYGFGNFYLFSDNSKSTVVCDGDIYIMPCEFTSMFKTYDMLSIYDTLQSSLVVYYIPLETKVNTFFDYGCNYRNTQSHNLQLEPGEITGYATQDRPLHQYNYIYSDNDVSNNIYPAKSLEEANTTYANRIIYSLYKTNGEFIDNWSIFKPADFIDADTRYGQITNLLTDKDALYFWLNQAFGKLSVNERSLVTDNNGSTILLGQGGVLQRTDYINTKYGMRDQDYSALAVEDNIYWIDINNKAIVGYLKGQYNTKSVSNYGELLNVQNILNKYMSTDIPTIHYDLLNSELLCGCLKANKLNDQLYYREYDTIDYNNMWDVDSTTGACSAIRAGNFYGRNFDWYYSNQCEFIVKTPHRIENDEELNAVIGVAGGISELTKDFVDSGKPSDKYDILPFKLQDGINEHGLVANYNVVPADEGHTESNPGKSTEIPILAIVRYILDHFSTVLEVVSFMTSSCTVMYSPKLTAMNYNLHIMVADSNNTCIIEFIEGTTRIKYVTTTTPYMTNFTISDVVPNSDKTVYTPEDGMDPHVYNNIDPRGSGLERWNLIAGRISTANSKEGMRKLLNDLKYSNSYNPNIEKRWYTEFVGDDNLTVSSTVDQFLPVFMHNANAFKYRDRNDPKFWYTTHSVIYDMANKKMYLCSQEQDEEYTFDFNYSALNQLVLNTKLNVATSVYTRDYDNILSFYNELYGLHTNNPVAHKYNYITPDTEYLSPTILEFAVNGSPSQTKVFDNQKIVTLKRNYNNYMLDKNILFITDLNESGSMTELTMIDPTDREGNICYSIPRDSKYEQTSYFKLPHGVGNRIRGKWMKVSMLNNNPKPEDSISHVITKFRQSYS